MSIGTEIVRDDFQRADVNPLGPNWSDVSGYGTSQIVSHLCEPSINTFPCMSYNFYNYNNPPALPADMYVEITVGAASLGKVGAGVRMTFTQNAYIFILKDGDAGNGIYRLDPTFALTPLAGATGSTAVSPNDVWRLVSSGSEFTLFQNGIKRYQGTDSTYPSGGFGAGIYQDVSTGALPFSDSQISLWAAGSAVLSVPTVTFIGTVATITGNDDGVTLTYTTDGSVPVPGVNGTVYTGPFVARFALTVKAVASLDGYTTSSVGSATMNPDPPFPHFNPENISAALFALLQTADYPFETYDRKGALPENVPAANQPYLGLVLLGAAQVENQAQGLEKWLLHFRVLVYIRADASSSAIPATELNNALQAIVEVLRTSAPIGERKTLGGLVDNCWINGDVLIDTGILDQQCALLIPITVDTGF